MKRFNDCFEAFITYIKEKKDCPYFAFYNLHWKRFIKQISKNFGF
jgi:hypothetical protein